MKNEMMCGEYVVDWYKNYKKKNYFFLQKNKKMATINGANLIESSHGPSTLEFSVDGAPGVFFSTDAETFTEVLLLGGDDVIADDIVSADVIDRIEGEFVPVLLGDSTIIDPSSPSPRPHLRTTRECIIDQRGDLSAAARNALSAAGPSSVQIRRGHSFRFITAEPTIVTDGGSIQIARFPDPSDARHGLWSFVPSAGATLVPLLSRAATGTDSEGVTVQDALENSGARLIFTTMICRAEDYLNRLADAALALEHSQ
jgi:hypothetical protein